MIRQMLSVSMLDNRRYTMRDIGKLEKRISNLEYYTSLNLLEKDTMDMKVTDADGNDRFKNGFIVDQFQIIMLARQQIQIIEWPSMEIGEN